VASKRSPQIKESLTYLGILFLICYGLNTTLIHGLYHSHEGAFSVWNDIKKGVDSDIIVNGDSRALVDFDPRVIEKETGHLTYVFGMHAMRPDLQLARLKIYFKHLKYGHKPRLIIQVVGIETLSPGQEGEARYYLPYLNENELYQTLLTYSKRFWLWRNVPLYGLAENGSLLTQLAIEGLLGKENISPDHYIKGFRPNNNQWTDDFEKLRITHPQGMRFDVLETMKQQLENIITLAQQNKVPIILVYPPEYVEAQHFFLHRPDIMTYYNNLSHKKGVPFMDYSNLPMTQTKDDFYNSQHLNAEGAKIFSRILSKDIAKFYLGNT